MYVVHASQQHVLYCTRCGTRTRAFSPCVAPRASCAHVGTAGRAHRARRPAGTSPSRACRNLHLIVERLDWARHPHRRRRSGLAHRSRVHAIPSNNSVAAPSRSSRRHQTPLENALPRGRRLSLCPHRPRTPSRAAHVADRCEKEGGRHTPAHTLASALGRRRRSAQAPHERHGSSGSLICAFDTSASAFFWSACRLVSSLVYILNETLACR